MSTIAPPTKPINPALIDSEHYIDDQIRRTRRALKLVDLAAGLITLAIGLLAFMLLAAVLDHWVVPGGLNTAGRGIVFGLMLAAIAWYGWRQFVPLLWSINPVYAAHTIERSTPSLKNSLLNLLMFRTHRQQMSTRVYHALEQQAAQRLSTATLDTAIDRSALLRLGYALLLIIAVCAAYAVLSPKDMAVSAARVLAPWSDLAPPSRVKILDVKPGETSVARGERLEISAEVIGLHADEAVRLRYSTADETLVDESMPMKRPTADARRFQGELPRGGDATVAAGVEKDLVYWIEAGDAHSKKYKVTVFERPTLVVQKVRYEYPAYTGFPSAEVGNTGDVRGLEGTQVTISALANQPIKSAYVDFDADGRSDLRMTVDGDRATASFALALREDRRTPQHGRYVLKFTSVEGRSNIGPPTYDIDVTPDYAPEVRVTSPEEPELTVRVDESIQISVEARDPDFALASVRLMGKVGDREATLAELLAKKHEGRFGAIKPFTPGDVRLKPGDVLEYWAEARDNRRPEANLALSEHRRLKIAGPADQPPPKTQKNGEPASAGGQNGQQQNGEKDQGGQQGQGGQQQAGDQAGGDSEGSEGEGQQGPGGAGAKGQQNEKSQSEQGAGGQGGTGESQSNDPQQPQEGGGAGGSSANNAKQSQNPQQQPQPNANPGEPASAGGPNAQAQPGAQGQPGNSQDNQQGAQQEKVSAEGDDDPEAFNRIAEHLNKQTDEQSGGAKQQGQPQNADEQNAQGVQDQAKPTASNQGQPNQGANAQGQPQNQQPGANSAGKPQEEQRPGDANDAQSPAAKPSGAAGQSGKQSQQKPPAEGAQPEGPAETASDAEQQTAPAGQNPSKRQGADAPRETKNGDGNPQDSQGAQKPSADSGMNRNDGNAGAGHNADEQEAAPGDEASAKRARTKTDDDNRPGRDDQEPPGGSPDKKESDSRGGKSGEQSGGGQKGGGQKADAAGKGDPGQHEAADDGAGRADEQGQGETGSKKGSDQTADGKTGESSGDKQGEGSQQGTPGKPGSTPKPGESASTQEAGEPVSAQKPGEPASAGGPDGQQPGANSAPKPGAPGAQPDAQQPKTANPPTDASQPGEPGDEQAPAKPQPSSAQPGESQQNSKSQPGEQQPSEQSSGGGQAGAAQPQGGGQGGEMTATDQQASEEAQEDEANLAFARKQTDLVLERLDDQLAKKQVDPNLLKSLGWSEAELRQFVNRWKDLKTRAANEGDEGAQSQQELDGALRSLGLRPQGPTRVRAASKADKLRVNDSYRSRAPIEYAERVNSYRKNLSTEADAEKSE